VSKQPKRAIYEVVIDVLRSHGGPMTVAEITTAILAGNRYPFGWRSPSVVPKKEVGRQISRYCEGTGEDYPKHFRKVAGGKIDLVHRSPVGMHPKGTLSPATPILTPTTSPQDPPSATPEASDLATPPSRCLVTTYRILRDTELARHVKALHKNKCQLCGHTIVLPEGSRYSEAHHIRPLGKPHDGPDAMDNIVCVCPNHHAELDYGARPLSAKGLWTAPGHSVNETYIRYHNEVIRGPKTEWRLACEIPTPTARFGMSHRRRMPCTCLCGA
jgi:hypothetical protein